MTEDAPPIIQPAILAPVVLDTTGVGDTFTATFFVGLLEKKSPLDSLKFAGCMLIFNSKYHPGFVDVGVEIVMFWLDWGRYIARSFGIRTLFLTI